MREKVRWDLGFCKTLKCVPYCLCSGVFQKVWWKEFPLTTLLRALTLTASAAEAATEPLMKLRSKREVAHRHLEWYQKATLPERHLE